MPAIWHPPRQTRDPELSFFYLDEDDDAARFENYSGEVLGDRYRLERPIGPGGTSTVYTAKDLRTGATVAVKVLHSGMHERLLGHFAQEGRAAARHASPHLIQAVDFGKDDDCAFTVFKFVDGVSLRTLARGGPMPWRRVCRIALHVLSALDALHRAGLVHNDLHASNVLIQRDLDGGDFAIVIDLGFASVLPNRRITHAPEPDGTIFGLRSSIAPERCAGCPPDPRSDLYSLGVMMWELITALPIPDVMLAPGKLAVPPLQVIAPGMQVPERVDAIVLRALSDVEVRFKTAAEMAQALREALDERELPAFVPPVVPVPRPAQPHVSPMLSGATGLVIGGAAILAVMQGTPDAVELEPTRQESHERAPSTTQQPPPAEPKPAQLAEQQAPPPAPELVLNAAEQPAEPPTVALLPTPNTSPPAQASARPRSSPKVATTRRKLRACDPEGTQVESVVTIERPDDGAPRILFNGRAAFGDFGDCVAQVARDLALAPGQRLRFNL